MAQTAIPTLALIALTVPVIHLISARTSLLWIGAHRKSCVGVQKWACRGRRSCWWMMAGSKQPAALPPQPPLQLLDQVEHGWADERTVCVIDGAEGEVSLVGERVSLAFLWPDRVDRASVVVAKKRARSRLRAITALFLVSFQVGGD